MAIAAPPLAGEDWLTGAPLNWDDLRGRWVLMSFWSAGCEASMTHLTELESLQRQHPDLAVVAIHAPRAPFAKDRNVPIEALVRHRLMLRVLHDPEMEMWSRYNPAGWPSSILINPKGKAVGTVAGTGVGPLVRDVLKLNMASGKPADAVPAALPRLQPPSVNTGDGLLRWPTAITVLGPETVALADTGNKRILVVNTNGDRFTVRQVISGVADVGDIHAPEPWQIIVSRPKAGEVVLIDLKSRKPRTLASGLVRPMGLTTDIDGSLVVADAGAEQLLRIDPRNSERDAKGAARAIAGSGKTGRVDGPGHRAVLAQPVAVTRVSAGLAFIDAATNNVRILSDKGRVVSVTDSAETDFGLVDGPPHLARFHRPTALVSLDDGSLLVADMGNSRIRKIAERVVSTVGVSGLCRPEGLTQLPDGRVLVCDTSNHRVVAVNLQTKASNVVNFEFNER